MDTSSPSRQKTWQSGRKRVSVLAEMALRKERVVERLAQLREQHSLTQEQAAQRVGVTHRQWQRWEAGESVPYPRNLDLIASKFGITVGEFFDEVAASNGTQLDRIESKLDAILSALTESDEAETEPEETAPPGLPRLPGAGLALPPTDEGPGQTETEPKRTTKLDRERKQRRA